MSPTPSSPTPGAASSSAPAASSPSPEQEQGSREQPHGSPACESAPLKSVTAGADPVEDIQHTNTEKQENTHVVDLASDMHSIDKSDGERDHRLVLSSSLPGTISKPFYAQEDLDKGSLGSHCPSCNRPVILSREIPEKAYGSSDGSKKRHAYLVILWSSQHADGKRVKQFGYVDGAIVLGQSIRNHSAGVKAREIDMVCLHTDDVPADNLANLEKVGWKCREIKHMAGICNEVFWKDRGMADEDAHRFDHVFTKLRLFEACIDYDKVLCMDIDTLVVKDMDHLFDLQAPAAMITGQSERPHGKRESGQGWFSGCMENAAGLESHPSWGRCMGINAGLMLLAPKKKLFKTMEMQLQDPNHPEHMRANGPEQEYLARSFAGQWTSIGTEYNWQLHQMMFVLAPHRHWKNYGEENWDKRARLVENVKPENVLGGLYMVHYSLPNNSKPWELSARFGTPEQQTEELEKLKHDFAGWKLFAEPDAVAWEDSLVRGSNRVLLEDHYDFDKGAGMVTWKQNGKGAFVTAEVMRGAKLIYIESCLEWCRVFRECVDQGLIDRPAEQGQMMGREVGGDVGRIEPGGQDADAEQPRQFLQRMSRKANTWARPLDWGVRCDSWSSQIPEEIEDVGPLMVVATLRSSLRHGFTFDVQDDEDSRVGALVFDPSTPAQLVVIVLSPRQTGTDAPQNQLRTGERASLATGDNFHVFEEPLTENFSVSAYTFTSMAGIRHLLADGPALQRADGASVKTAAGPAVFFGFCGHGGISAGKSPSPKRRRKIGQGEADTLDKTGVEVFDEANKGSSAAPSVPPPEDEAADSDAGTMVRGEAVVVQGDDFPGIVLKLLDHIIGVGANRSELGVLNLEATSDAPTTFWHGASVYTGCYAWDSTKGKRIFGGYSGKRIVECQEYLILAQK